MPFEVPALPYDYAALEPTIDEQTMRLHHDKHHQAYVDKANAALEGTEWADKPVEEVLQNLDRLPADKQGPVRNNAGGHFNHSLFWELMSPEGGGEPEGALAQAIDETFGGLDAFKEELAAAGGQPLRQRLGLARLGRLRPPRHVDAEPGPAHPRGTDAAPRPRRLGARVLPDVPEPPSRLRRGLVERRQLARGRAPLRGGRRLGRHGLGGLARSAASLPRRRRPSAWMAPPTRSSPPITATTSATKIAASASSSSASATV